MKSALKEIDLKKEDSEKSPIGGQIQQLLSDQAYAKFDLFIDDDKRIRKTNSELQIPLNDTFSPVSAIKITAAFENWNANQPVTSDKIDLSAGKLELKDSSSFKEYILLNNLDK